MSSSGGEIATDLSTRLYKTMKTRYAICGLSARAIGSYIFPLAGLMEHGNVQDFSAFAEIVGVMDIDEERVSSFSSRYGIDIPFHCAHDGVDAMIEKTRPDVLIVAGPDFTHCAHIISGLQHGLRVIAEKPIVINCEEARAVIDAEAKSSGSLVAAHNYRYVPINRKLKELIMSGAIGNPTNAEFVYNLDTFHGPSYFQRWNRVRAKSGGMTIHKSVHHLDLINWLLDSEPEAVFSFGARNYFGVNGANKPREDNGRQLSLAETRAQCPYFKRHYEGRRSPAEGRIVLGWECLKLPYHSLYPRDGYIYDEEIDIEDTYSAVVKYASGASMAFSCNFSTPWEGYQLAINGTRGRIEANYHTVPDETGHDRPSKKEQSITLMPLFGERKMIPVPKAAGGHGGSDPLIQHDLFLQPGHESLELGLPANSHQAALAIATGEAIWRSVQDGRPYSVQALLEGVAESHDIRTPETV